MSEDSLKVRATTILCVRKNGTTVLASDGQVSIGDMVCKNTASKVRRLGSTGVVAGFAGSVADCLTLLSRLEGKLEQYSSDMIRSVIEMSKDWRTDKYLRNLEASMIVADKKHIMVVSGNGEAVEMESGIASVGSGSKFALSAAMALIDFQELTAEEVVRRAMKIAGDLCVFTNNNLTIETIS